MPIDFAAIADTFRGPVRREMNPIVDSFRRLAAWLGSRVERTDALELASRDYPVIRFYQEAITAWVDGSQHQSLGPPAPSPSVWDRLHAAGRALVSGVGGAGQSIQEALILPRFLAMLGDVLDLVLGSLERFSEPTPGLFDPAQRRASDLFGEAGLFFRAFGTSLKEVRGMIQGAAALGRAIRPPPSPAERLQALARSAAGAAGGSGPAERTIGQVLGEVGRYLTGAILALPLVPSLLGGILRSADLALRVGMVDLFERIESAVFRLRRWLIHAVYVLLMDQVRHVISLVAAVGDLLMDNVRYYANFGLMVGRAFVDSASSYLRDLSAYIRYWTDLAEGLRRTLEALENVNLTPVILGALGLPGWLLSRVPAPRFTLGDLFDVGAGVGITAARGALNSAISAAETIVLAAAGGSAVIPFVETLDPRPILRRIEALRRIFNIVVRIPQALPAETRLPSLRGVHFPNIFEAFFGPGVPNLGSALDRLRNQMVEGIPAILDTGAAFLESLSDRLQGAARQASRLGSPDQLRAIAERADTLSAAVFGDQATALRRRIEARGEDPLAATLEGWIARSGFELVGQVIPRYVAEMEAYWQEQSSSEQPTSPHILRRRRRLARVQVPRLTLRAPGRALDDALVGTVAGRFREAIRDAYLAGRVEYERAAAA